MTLGAATLLSIYNALISAKQKHENIVLGEIKELSDGK